MKSLLYVSVRTIRPDAAAQEIDDIVTGSRGRNAELGLTGALVATPLHYAQILEGPMPAIDTMMASIERDPRHHSMVIAPIESKRQREFHRWALAYHGESSYVSEMIATALEAPSFELSLHAQSIRSLMAMFG